MKKLLLISLCILPIFGFSQNIAIQAPQLINIIDLSNDGLSTFFGIITDEELGEPLPFVIITLELNGVQVATGNSDFDGNFHFSNLAPGEYTMSASFIGFQPHRMSFKLYAETKYFYDCKMESNPLAFSCCFGCCCRVIIEEEEEPLPITDLFAEQDSIAQQEASSGPPSSIDEQVEPLLKVFPNPVQSELTVSGLMGIEQLMVLDLSGKLLKQISIQEVPSVSLNVKSFVAGIYLIQFEKDGKPQVQKFIKH